MNYRLLSLSEHDLPYETLMALAEPMADELPFNIYPIDTTNEWLKDSGWPQIMREFNLFLDTNDRETIYFQSKASQRKPTGPSRGTLPPAYKPPKYRT